MKRNIRTDLALEAHEIGMREAKRINGVVLHECMKGNIKVSRLEVISDEGAKAIGKPRGNYVTIEAPNIKYDMDEFENACELTAAELSKMADITPDKLTLVVGLGNREMTPDALGTSAAEEILVTHHMMKQYRAAFGDGVSSVCAIAPGVMGNTGMETMRTVKAVAQNLKPDLIIVVDALAAADLGRLCTTIQLSDAGIAPGSGVGNDRQGLNEETLGTKVISVGVPTVIDAYNICDIEIPEEVSPMMVTVKDIDLVIRRMASAVAGGINLSLHKGVTLRDIMCFMG
ncbi:MAG: GPR endopeptidase [Clostridiales bacterium]|nr:GPR endopeptidase [Clostridiales bacterium]